MPDEQVASGDAADLALAPEVEQYFARHSGEPPVATEALTTQEPEPETPAEAEAEPEKAPSADAPSATEQAEAEPSVSDADWKRWFGLAAKTLETERPQWSQMPKSVRESVATALDEELGGSTARDALHAWEERVVATPEEIVERENAAATKARQEAALEAQWAAYNSQVWGKFAALDPELNPNLGDDDYDLFEAQRQDQQGYAHFQQLKEQYRIQNDPQAQVEQVATQRAVTAQRELLSGLIGGFLSESYFSGVPSIRAQLEQAKGNDGFLESQGYEASMDGLIQWFVGRMKEASEHHGTTKAAKKVMEKSADIQAAAERAARGKALQQGLVRDTTGTGTASAPFMPPPEALRGGTDLVRWMAANPEKKSQWVAAGRPGYRGAGWAGRQGAMSQRQ